MPIRLPCTRRTPAALLLAGLLFLPLFAAPKLPAGEDDSCPAQGCDHYRHSPDAAAKSSAKLVRVTYQVADLVVPIPGVVLIPDGATVADGLKSSSAKTTEDQLIKRITGTVEPRSWSNMGGAGTIDYHPLTMYLIINQTPEIQEQILDLLNSLRRLQDQQVSLEVRFLSVDEALARRLIREGKEGAGSEPVDPADPSLRVTFLSGEQAGRLLEAAQADPKTNVMQAPKATVFDGQTSSIDVTEPKPFVTGVSLRMGSNGSAAFQPTVEEIPVGLRMTARPVISADRRFVKVGLNVNLTSLDKIVADTTPIGFSYTLKGKAPTAFTQLLQTPSVSRLALDGAISIPDGGTALISGWRREHEARVESGLPMLSEIPYLNRLFKSVGYHRETECVLMMVTPRIIIEEEKEEVQTSYVEQASFPCKGAPERSAAPARFKQAEAAELVAKYHRACAEGRDAEATRLAVQALAIDPTCFHADGGPALPCESSPAKDR